MKSVLVLGSINRDYIVQSDRSPKPGETILGKSLMNAPGGKGANQAVAAARLGAAVTMFGAVGTEPAGGEMVASLRREGIDVAGVERSGDQSGAAVLTVTEDGENSIIVIPGANHTVGHKQVEKLRAAIKVGDIVVIQLEIPLLTVSATLAVSRERGALTILNAAPAADVLSELANVDILVVNEAEAAQLWGNSVESSDQAVTAGTALRHQGAGVVIVTLGANGSVVITSEGAHHIPAVPVEAVDTTGAGDTFVGALAASLADDVELIAAVTIASHAAAATCAQFGAQTSMPTSSMLAMTWPVP